MSERDDHEEHIYRYETIICDLKAKLQAAEAEVDALKILCAGKHEAFVRLADIINPERDTDAFEAATRLRAEVARLTVALERIAAFEELNRFALDGNTEVLSHGIVWREMVIIARAALEVRK